MGIMLHNGPGYKYVLILCFVLLQGLAKAQPETGETPSMTLKQCIDYAMKHQPMLNQAQINVMIARTTNAISLSGWFPQVNAAGNMTHYAQLPTAFQTNPANPNGPPNIVKTGIPNAASPGLSATQALFSPVLLYAAKSAHLYIEAANQVTDSTKINIVSSTSKAFYNLLLTLQQIEILKADTIELNRSVTDAYHQFVGGIVDETDYEEATITLNNALVQLKQAVEAVTPQYAVLKEAIGFPPEKQFNVLYDTTEMIRNIFIDSTRQLQYEKRVEFQQLSTAKKLQQQLISYYKLAFLPTVSGFYNYTYQFGNSEFSKLFSTAYPYSSLGLSLSIPIFTGFSRVESLRRAHLQEHLLDWDETSLKEQINAQYTSALANYKSNLYSFQVMQRNVALAKKVYFTVELQYKQGIVAYLNVITAQSNLITSEIGYINALFQVLSNKIDLEKAMGDIVY